MRIKSRIVHGNLSDTKMKITKTKCSLLFCLFLGLKDIKHTYTVAAYTMYVVYETFLLLMEDNISLVRFIFLLLVTKRIRELIHNFVVF